MGLDMYLYTNSRKVCQEVNDMADEWEGGYQAKHGIAIQWRKANAIHRWFVENIQEGDDDCKEYRVSVEDLCRLHDACVDVLESTELVEADIQNGYVLEDGKMVPIMEKGQRLADPSVAKEVLPTKEGFFFGQTDYDQWYWWDLQFTRDKIAKLLDCLTADKEMPWNVYHKDEPDWYVSFRYTSSW